MKMRIYILKQLRYSYRNKKCEKSSLPTFNLVSNYCEVTAADFCTNFDSKTAIICSVYLTIDSVTRLRFQSYYCHFAYM